MTQRIYTPKERAEAVARVAAGERPTAVARDLGVSVQALRKWRLSLAQDTSQPGLRGPDGRLLPGKTANPGGSSSARERAQRLAEEAAPKAIEDLTKLANKLLTETDPKKAKLLAEKAYALKGLWKELLDRGLGKPTQRVTLEATHAPAEDLAHLPDEQLQAAAGILRPRGQEEGP